MGIPETQTQQLSKQQWTVNQITITTTTANKINGTHANLNDTPQSTSLSHQQENQDVQDCPDAQGDQELTVKQSLDHVDLEALSVFVENQECQDFADQWAHAEPLD